MSLSLKNKLSLAASSAILLVGAILSTKTYITNKSQVENAIKMQVTDLGNTFAASVNYWFNSKGASLLAMPTDPAISDDMRVTQLKHSKMSGDYDNLFFARADGSQLNANGVTLPEGNNDPRKWDWYQKAVANPQKVYLQPPSIAAATGQYVISIAKAMQANGQVFAVLGADVTVTELLKQLSHVKLPGGGFAFLINKDGIIYAHPDNKLLAKPISTLYPTLDYNQLLNLPHGEFKLLEHDGKQERIYSVPVEGQDQMLVFVLDDGAVLQPVYNQTYTNLGVLLLVLLVSLSGFNWMCNMLFRPLGVVSQALSRIASGRGDLTQRIPLQSKDEIGMLAQHFNQFVGSLHELITNIRMQAQEFGSEANQVQDKTRSSTTELSRQQQEIAMVATAVTEMSSATQEIANNAEQTAAAANLSAKNSQDGLGLVHKTRESINQLANGVSDATGVIAQLDHHAKDINGILSTIQGIAEQTNLLALNAAIEAARAGEQGRGFAVVADEVRVLSQRTAASTSEIQSTIETLQQTTQQAVKLMEKSQDMASSSVHDALDASAALEEITQAITRISDMASHIATAAEEQSHVTSEITANITAIKDVSDQIADDAQQTLQSVNSLQHQATELNGRVEHYIL